MYNKILIEWTFFIVSANKKDKEDEDGHRDQEDIGD